MKKLPKVWYLRFKTKEVFEELCLPYRSYYTYLSEAGITNIDNGEAKLEKYYYLPNKDVSGEEITYEEFKQFTTKIKKEDFSYLKKLFKKLNIQ